jgi:Protein of unknown function (DUF2865)
MKSYRSPYYLVGSVSKGADERWGLADRRLRPALLTGSAFFLLGAVIFAGELAAAMGGNPLATMNTAPSFEPLPSALPMVPQFGLERSRDHVRLRDRHTARKRTASLGGRSAVCVRLCDGFHFPSVLSSGGDEACASQCPDAPTAFYSMPAGSEKIDDAVSLTGAPYSALPVANRNQTSFDNTCTCHRSSVTSYIADLLHDRTLRDGDLVMTAKGFRVFKGDKSGVVQPSNFVALSPSSSVAKASGAELKAMESAGIWDRQYGPYSYSAPAAETKQTLIAARRPHKGIVTVDDGDANP